jgi:hypothetical protein
MCSRKLLSALVLSGAFAATVPAPGAAAEVDGYSFSAAAQEVTQLYWLAETAAACGWATYEDSARFKLFSLRFLTAHLSEVHRAALVALVTRAEYADGVRNAAHESATESCASNRWHAGWITYKAAADENEERY